MEGYLSIHSSLFTAEMKSQKLFKMTFTLLLIAVFSSTSTEYYNYHSHLYAIGDYFVEIKLTAITSDVESIHVTEAYDIEKFISHKELPIF